MNLYLWDNEYFYILGKGHFFPSTCWLVKDKSIMVHDRFILKLDVELAILQLIILKL